jgi:(p)ppGpp synthase/HD superfamily hydrolase
MDGPHEMMTLNLERALRWAATCHQGQFRRGCEAPYIEHAMGVALILDRLGFAEDVVIAGLLHDVVEDTDATLEQIEARFGTAVAETVRRCSEIKTDAQGRKRPWIDRKRDHLEALREAPVAARAVILADKLHNLVSIELDLREGRSVWPSFNAERAQVLWYYRTTLAQLGPGDPRLEALAAHALRTLAALEAFEAGSADGESERSADEADDESDLSADDAD